MKHFRNLLNRIDQAGELLTVERNVDARFELPALLKQAEARRKAVRFNCVNGQTAIPVVGGLLTSAPRMALGLGLDNAGAVTRTQHAGMIREALANPLKPVTVAEAPCQELIVTDEAIDLAALPVPTFFADDSGPFLTAAVGIARNPDNGVLNVGIYRVLITGKRQLAVSASPSSNLFAFMQKARASGDSLPVALVIGPDPAVLMAAAAKAPPEVSELDVAGALNGEPLELAPARCSDLLVPAHAEIVLEVSIDFSAQITNTMGEFGDYYGDTDAPLARVEAVTRRKDALFHTIMAGAGSEHNSIGFIILYDLGPQLFAALKPKHPGLGSVRVCFEPPRMGIMGDVYLKLDEGAATDPAELICDAFACKCGIFDIARVIRRVIVVDHDIDIESRQEIDWAVATRANLAGQIYLFEDLPAAAGKVRIGINACANPDEKISLRRLEIPGATDIRLDDYLG
jgi:2,5-furandicarboxylate decarboxylase 1